MAKKKTVSIDINLTPKDPFYSTYLGKILKWALSVGRYIVIFTELVVIISFVTRFSLDRQVTDLNQAIERKKTIIESYGDLEQNTREAQVTIDHYQQIKQQVTILDVFPNLTEITPRSVTLDKLIIRPSDVTMTGTTPTQQALNTLITNMQISPAFFDINIQKIAQDEETGVGYQFQIDAKTKEQTTQNQNRGPAQ